MSGVNKAIVLGNLGKDPEIRQTTDGKKIANLSIATSETWTDKATNEKQEKTEWHRVVIFNSHLSEIAEKYLKKGSKVYVEGSMKTRKYTDNNGIEKYTTEIVLSAYDGALQIVDTKQGSGLPPPANEDDFLEGSRPKQAYSTDSFDDGIPW